MQVDSRSQQPPRRARALRLCSAPRRTLGVVGAAHAPRGRLRPRPAPAPAVLGVRRRRCRARPRAGAVPAPPGLFGPAHGRSRGLRPQPPIPRGPEAAAACADSPASMAVSPPGHRGHRGPGQRLPCQAGRAGQRQASTVRSGPGCEAPSPELRRGRRGQFPLREPRGNRMCPLQLHPPCCGDGTCHVWPSLQLPPCHSCVWGVSVPRRGRWEHPQALVSHFYYRHRI